MSYLFVAFDYTMNQFELWGLLDEFTLLFFCKSCYGYILRCRTMLRNYPQNYDLMIEVPYKSMVNEFIRFQRARLLALLKYSQFI